jgi:hypothetical protein
LRAQFAIALSMGRPIVADLGECTYASVEVLELLSEASISAERLGSGFVVVLPYTGTALVRRLLFEIAPELTTFPVLPSLPAALAELQRRREPGRCAARVDARLQSLRARIWENASRLHAQMARRDALLLETRDELALVRSRRLRSA